MDLIHAQELLWLGVTKPKAGHSYEVKVYWPLFPPWAPYRLAKDVKTKEKKKKERVYSYAYFPTTLSGLQRTLLIPQWSQGCFSFHYIESLNGWGWKASLEFNLSDLPYSSTATYSQLSRQLLSISKDGDTTTSLGNLHQCLVTLTIKKYFLVFRGKLLCFSMFLLSLVLFLGTTGKSLTLSYLHPHFRYLCILIRSPVSLLFPRLNSPSS